MRSPATPLTSQQVYSVALDFLQPHFQLQSVFKRGRVAVTVTAFYLVLFLAASRLGSICAACRRLVHGPDEELLLKGLLACLPEYREVQNRVNAAFAAMLPRSLRRAKLRLAIDLVLIPYYGKLWGGEDLYYRSQAKRGTCTFLAYATAFVIHRGQRYTLALTVVTRKMTMRQVLEQLLNQVSKLPGRLKIGLLLLDRGFYSVEAIQLLRTKGVPFLMPAVIRGKKPDHPKGPSGTRVFAEMKTSGWFEYTLTSSNGEQAKVQVCVKCRNRRGERKKHGREALVYVYGAGYRPNSYDEVRQTYRQRFGIETSYRQLHQCRVRTSTKHFELRVFLVGLALLLRNVWVWLHDCVLSSVRRGRGGKTLRLHRLRLREMLDGLGHYAESVFGRKNAIYTERPIPQCFEAS